jgi:hypothetical protein
MEMTDIKKYSPFAFIVALPSTLVGTGVRLGRRGACISSEAPARSARSGERVGWFLACQVYHNFGFLQPVFIICDEKMFNSHFIDTKLKHGYDHLRGDYHEK